MAFQQTITQMQVPQFESRLQVLRVRPTYIAAFKKCRYLYLEKIHLASKRHFLNYLSRLTEKWPNGTFYLKLSNGKVFDIDGENERFLKTIFPSRKYTKLYLNKEK